MKDFLSDAKACAIISLIVTVGAYLIGTLFLYFNGKGSVSWVFCMFFYLIVFGILLIATRSYNDEYQLEKQIQKRIATQLQQEKENEILLTANQAQEYDAQYGDCTKVISSPKGNNPNFIRVYEGSSTIILTDIPYKFEEIIGYNLTDNSRVIKGELSSSTSTSNTSAIGRAVVGAAIGGVAGAVIGGATAKQTTKYNQGEDMTVHDYTINVNVNRLSDPLVKLHIGKDEGLANEIVALINAVVIRNS